jgi:hypothetical protein
MYFVREMSVPTLLKFVHFLHFNYSTNPSWWLQQTHSIFPATKSYKSNATNLQPFTSYSNTEPNFGAIKACSRQPKYSHNWKIVTVFQLYGRKAPMQVYEYSQLKQQFMLNTNKHEDVFSSLNDPLHSYWLILSHPPKKTAITCAALLPPNNFCQDSTYAPQYPSLLHNIHLKPVQIFLSN